MLIDWCGSPDIWPNFTAIEYDDTKTYSLAQLPSCLWHIILALIPFGWTLISLPFFISDIRKKRRKPLNRSLTYWIKIIGSLIFTGAPICQLILIYGHDDLNEDYSVLPGQLLSNISLGKVIRISKLYSLYSIQYSLYCIGYTDTDIT